MHWAVDTLKNPVVPLLLKANISLDVIDANGNTPLMMVVTQGDIVTLELLLEHHPDVNIVSPKGGHCIKECDFKSFGSSG